MKIENINGFTIKLKGQKELITDSIVEELKKINPTFYFQDNECYYWIFDFKINDVWFEMPHCTEIPKELILNVFQ